MECDEFIGVYIICFSLSLCRGIMSNLNHEQPILSFQYSHAHNTHDRSHHSFISPPQ